MAPATSASRSHHAWWCSGGSRGGGVQCFMKRSIADVPLRPSDSASMAIQVTSPPGFNFRTSSTNRSSSDCEPNPADAQYGVMAARMPRFLHHLHLSFLATSAMMPRSPHAFRTASRPVAVGREQFSQMNTIPRARGIWPNRSGAGSGVQFLCPTPSVPLSDPMQLRRWLDACEDQVSLWDDCSPPYAVPINIVWMQHVGRKPRCENRKSQLRTCDAVVSHD